MISVNFQGMTTPDLGYQPNRFIYYFDWYPAKFRNQLRKKKNFWKKWCKFASRLALAAVFDNRFCVFDFMDFKTVVFNAASDGKLQRLKIYLDHRSQNERHRLIHAKTNGATPLIMACRNGHLDIIQYLIETCKVDIEQVGSVGFDGETIEGAPPLWCAAAAGHDVIVEYLVKNGAKVNNTTFTNSTPLRAACFDGHFNVVKFLIQNGADIEIPNRHGHTCLMISCYKGHYQIVQYLLNLKVDVDRKSMKGNTALHDCAESGSLEILKLLLNHGAKMDKDSYSLTPLLAASVSGHTNIVEYLISREECTPEERINALELLGATYVDKKRDMLGALQYWRRSLNLRLGKEGNRGEVPKVISTSSIAAYEGVREFETQAELLDAVSDADNMRMQALLIRERILGPAHPDTSYYIRYRGAVYADMGNFERCITLWMYALDMQLTNLEALNPMTQSSFISFAELFSFMMSDSRAGRPNEPVSFYDMMVILTKSIEELKRGRQALLTSTSEKDTSYYNRHLIIIMHLLALVCKNMAQLTSEQILTFKKQVYKLVHLKPLGVKGSSLLHLACSSETSSLGRDSLCPFPSLDVITLLIEVGADIGAYDAEGSTPLHVSASQQPCNYDIVKTLLNARAHLDACNDEGKTALELLPAETASDVGSPLQYVNLQCLSARVLVKHNINYRGLVTDKMAAFISMH